MSGANNCIIHSPYDIAVFGNLTGSLLKGYDIVNHDHHISKARVNNYWQFFINRFLHYSPEISNLDPRDSGFGEPRWRQRHLESANSGILGTRLLNLIRYMTSWVHIRTRLRGIIKYAILCRILVFAHSTGICFN